ncbi:MAG: biotin/lipoyl-containing protein [Myxococcota bacterium]
MTWAIVERVEPGIGGQTQETRLVSPTVGLFQPDAHLPGVVSSGTRLGTLSLLSQAADLLVPDGVLGQVTRSIPASAVEYRSTLVVLSPLIGQELDAPSSPPEDEGCPNVFRAPSAGRLFLRPAPGEPPFVAVNDVLSKGRCVGFLEVMKTFNRVLYDGPDVVVTRVLLSDGQDVRAGAPIFALHQEGEQKGSASPWGEGGR